MVVQKRDFRIVRYEQMDEYGNYDRTIIESHDNYEDAVQSLKEYIAANDRHEVEYDIDVMLYED